MGQTSYFARDLASLALTSLMRFCSCLSCSAWYSAFNLQTSVLQHALCAFLTRLLQFVCCAMMHSSNDICRAVGQGHPPDTSNESVLRLQTASTLWTVRLYMMGQACHNEETAQGLPEQATLLEHQARAFVTDSELHTCATTVSKSSNSKTKTRITLVTIRTIILI